MALQDSGLRLGITLCTRTTSRGRGPGIPDEPKTLDTVIVIPPRMEGRVDGAVNRERDSVTFGRLPSSRTNRDGGVGGIHRYRKFRISILGRQ